MKPPLLPAEQLQHPHECPLCDEKWECEEAECIDEKSMVCPECEQEEEG